MRKITAYFVVLFSLTSVYGQLSSSNLPIFVINTKGQTIVDEPKILAEMQVIYNGEGKINNLSDKNFHYNSFVGIEYRGSSSQSFPKKPYSIELRNSKGENNPLALCGLPQDSDWILFASYNEKSLMHNVLSMSLARQIGMNGSRTKYVEVIVNGQYDGVYVLMEKIKVDKNRVNIANLKQEDIAGDELTGGYIIKIDKATGTNYGSFFSDFTNVYGSKVQYFYHLPKTINTTQKEYIRNYVKKFETAVYGKDYKDDLIGYKQYVDLPSFAKMFIINEVSRNIDGYRISSYFYKDKDSKGGKLVASPPWDYDISYGNADYCQGNRFDLWAYKFNDICSTDYWQVPGFWSKMVSDPAFVAELKTFYFKERETGGVFDYDRILKEINEYQVELKDAYKRNFVRWPILGVYVWPGPQPVPNTWEGEINELTLWLRLRLQWLDANMPTEFVLTANELPEEQIKVTAFPNPFVDKLQVNIISQNIQDVEISFSDALGKAVLYKKVKLIVGENTISFDEIPNVNQYLFMKVKTKDGDVDLKKVLRVR
ncbi:spore coat protein CotH [Lacihabitans sp. LS3-19]|uniref:CotH kinase family protein n=1 Tax=Lacihabitans sp. LS3-19 TaxID=2487335 RepID=UPI0020CF91A3|nr:CotH kinase family protein [Lacihabitans sp. LS3-19]MCP9770828.1 spore coat protein CotH [Lacihabitans sp. LS3-19]